MPQFLSQETMWGETCKRWLQKKKPPWACAKNVSQGNNQHDHYHPYENQEPKWSMCPSIVHNAFSCSYNWLMPQVFVLVVLGSKLNKLHTQLCYIKTLMVMWNQKSPHQPYELLLSFQHRSNLLLWRPTHDHQNYITSRRQHIISLVSSTKAWANTNIKHWFSKFIKIIELSSWFWRALCVWEHFNETNVVCKKICFVHFCWFFSQKICSSLSYVIFIIVIRFCFLARAMALWFYVKFKMH